MPGSSGGCGGRFGRSTAATEGGFAGPAIPPIGFDAATAFDAAPDGAPAGRETGESGFAGFAVPPIVFGALGGGVGKVGAFGASGGGDTAEAFGVVGTGVGAGAVD
jgi:hypothetical protein